MVLLRSTRLVVTLVHDGNELWCETLPFLVLKLTETGGALTGTMSRFTVGGHSGEGGYQSLPLPQPADQISDLKVSDSDLSFHWVGDTPFHGGDVLFVAEGTDVAYIMLPISEEESERIYADNWGLGGLYPTIALLREGTSKLVSNRQTGSSDWRQIEPTARLINRMPSSYTNLNTVCMGIIRVCCVQAS